MTLMRKGILNRCKFVLGSQGIWLIAHLGLCVSGPDEAPRLFAQPSKLYNLR